MFWSSHTHTHTHTNMCILDLKKKKDQRRLLVRESIYAELFKVGQNFGK